MISSDVVILKILNILKERSDEDHPLTYFEIGDILESEYHITLERKAIGRKIDALIEEGYDIVKGRGCYLNRREFSNPEIRILTDLIASSKYISEENSKELISKIISFGPKTFRENLNPNLVWNKTDNSSVFENLEKISEAIEKKKMISFIRKKYSFENQEVKSTFKGTPLKVFIKDGKYYVLLIPEHIIYNETLEVNLEWIYDVEILQEDANMIDVDFIETIDKNGNVVTKAKKKRLNNTGREVTFLCDFIFASEVEEIFGTDVKITPLNKESVGEINAPCKVTLFTTSSEAKAFALANLENCFLMEPKDLSLDVYEKIVASKNFYNIMNKVTSKEVKDVSKDR